jgi:hypothetical protein
MNDALPIALARNAASKPLNLVVLVLAFVVTLALSLPGALVVIVPFVAYTAAVARTMFDRAETARVEARLAAAPDDQP